MIDDWEEFLDRLEGPEGCNFTQTNPDDVSTTSWTCHHDHRFSRKILGELGYSRGRVDGLIVQFETRGGYCDCEVLFNVAPRVEEEEYPAA